MQLARAQLKYRGHIGDRDTSSAPKVDFTGGEPADVDDAPTPVH